MGFIWTHTRAGSHMHGWTYKYTHAHKSSHACIWVPEDALYFSVFIITINHAF